MSSLSDAEILAALPVESRQKINNAFEALSQSLPSPAEQATLYRVVHTLKLNQTDSVFSFVSALHLYLQLYQTIPDKIAKAGGEIRQVGADVDAAIRKATHETLTEHAGALKVQAELVAAQNQKALIRDVGKIAQQIAGNTAAAERHKSFVWAAGSLTLLSMVMFVAGMALGSNNGMGWGFLSVLALGIGFLGGLVALKLLYAGGQVSQVSIVKDKESNSFNDEQWTETRRIRATKALGLEPRVAAACRQVLRGNKSVEDAARIENLLPQNVQKALLQFQQWSENN